jgi:ABC-type transport system substrate-binding protein
MRVKSVLYIGVCLLLSTAFIASIPSVFTQSEQKDQYQEISEVCEHVDTYWDSWQEFVPTVNSLSRVEVKINRYENYPNEYPITMTIESPLGTVLTSKTLQWEEIPELPWGETVWISFDVPDITLTPGQSYYIHLDSEPLAYLWSAANYDAYPPGQSNFAYPWDWTFRTFYVAGPSGVIQHYGQPRFDDAYLITVNTPSAQRAAFEACQVEMLPDMLTWADIAALLSENQIMYASPGYHYCYIGINCRDYVPDDYGQPDAGRPLDPLNWTVFRQALAWAGLNLAMKSYAINTIYGGPAVTAVNNPVPPALGYWSNTALVDPGGNFAQAWTILQNGGFYISGGKLYTPSGNLIRNTITVLSPSAASTSVAFAQAWVNQWNLFFGTYLGVTNCVFANAPMAMSVIQMDAFYYRNFDLYFLCWSLGKFPDYLYDFFHSSQEGVGQNNAPGIKDAALDAQLEILKWDTDHEAKLDACWEAQRLLVEVLVPCVYVYSRTYYTAFKNYTYYDSSNPNYLVNMINMKGYGADNSWTWGLMHWSTNDTGGTLKYCNTGSVAELHPGWASWTYEWKILNRVFDGLLNLKPDTLEDLAWIAPSWSTRPFVWPDLGVTDGQVVRFQIRDGVLWHDLEPVTVQDIQFALEFLRNFPRYSAIYQYLLWSQIVDPCTIDIYLNTTSQWIIYDLADVALLFPEHMYAPNGWLANHGYDPVTADVWNIPYIVGSAKKALIGCGPYVFDNFSPTTGVAYITKFNRYWVDGPLKQSFISPQRVDPDTTFQFYVEVVNTGSKDTGTGELVPAIIDYIDITLDDEVIFSIPGFTLQPFSQIVLGPYDIALPAGLHHLDCHTVAYGETYDNYQSPVWITLKEDVNRDFYVGIDDIFAAAKAFGSQPPPFPGYERWDERCDMNGDYYVGIDDIFDIAHHYGWGT